MLTFDYDEDVKEKLRQQLKAEQIELAITHSNTSTN